MIQGERVVLRAIEREDLPRYVRWLNDPTVLEYFGRYLPLSLAQEEKWFEEMLEDSTVCNWAIDFEGRHIGGAGFSHIDGRNARAEIGLFIGVPELWDQGLGYDALEALLHFGFDQMNLHRIYLRVLAGNQRAIHLYTKLGFQHEGRWRDAAFRHGCYHDILWMSILREEWTD
ncbi:MAG: GNAT family protein [Anaerolineae bacterium]|jgi:RimJ/RimL family protein N-acetyltransferase